MTTETVAGLLAKGFKAVAIILTVGLGVIVLCLAALITLHLLGRFG